MCLAHGTPNHPNGRRCEICSPAGRRDGRRAKHLFGELTRETRAKLAALPIEFRTGSTYARAKCAMKCADPLAIEAALNDRPAVLKALAKNPHLTSEDAGILAVQVPWFDRTQMVRANADRPEILAVLASDRDPRVREMVATAKGSDAVTLALLAADSAPRVAALAKGSATPVDGLSAFAQDGEIPVSIRTRVLTSKVEPGDPLVKELSSSKAAELRELAARRTTDPALRGALMADRSAAVSCAAFKNWRTGVPGQSLEGGAEESLVKAGSPHVRRKLAESSQDDSVLSHLLEDGDEAVASLAAFNSATPEAWVEAKAPGSDTIARSLAGRYAMRGEGNPPAHLQESSARIEAIQRGVYSVEDALTDPNPRVRGAAAYRSFIDSPIDQWASAEKPEDRLRAFTHPKLDQGIVTSLLSDPDRSVRQKAVSSFTVTAAADLDRHPAVLEALSRPTSQWSTKDQALAAELIEHSNPHVQLAGIRSLSRGKRAINEKFAAAHPELVGELISATTTGAGFTPEQLVEHWGRLDASRQREAILYAKHPFTLSLKSKLPTRDERREAAGEILTPREDLLRLTNSKDARTAGKAKMTLQKLDAAA